MDKLNTTIARHIDFNATETTPAAADVRNDVRSLEENELVYVGGGESIPTW